MGFRNEIKGEVQKKTINAHGIIFTDPGWPEAQILTENE